MAGAATIRERVLIVDDDEQSGALLARILDREGYRCDVAGSAAQGRAALARAPYDVLVCDVRLPDGSGLELTETILAEHQNMAAIMVSGLDDVALAERALKLGAYAYVVKPFSANEVLIAVLGALRHRNPLASNHDDVRAAQQETIQRLCVAIEARDPEAAPSIRRMSITAYRIACELRLPFIECELILAASQLHDVGNVGVPDAVLMKSGPLSSKERSTMERHTEIGYRILAGSRAPLLSIAAMIAWTHHERWDGEGYPRALAGDEIPLEGRIAAVADAFVALTHDRPHRPRYAAADALAFMEEQRERAFDPAVLEAFFDVDRRLDRERRADQGDDPPWPVGVRPFSKAQPNELSPREREVLQLAAHGLSTAEIGHELAISAGTVKAHFQRIYPKLEARDRAAAVATALRRGLIQ